MKTKIWRHSHNSWEAICLDFDIAVQGRSLEEVVCGLNGAVSSYKDYVSTLPENDRSYFLSRAAPKSVLKKGESMEFCFEIGLADEDDNDPSYRLFYTQDYEYRDLEALLAEWVGRRNCEGCKYAYFNIWENPDKVYSSKVFSWSANNPYLPSHTVKSGTGYGIYTDLPEAVEHICPDYEFYGLDYSLGFLTRGCSRSCEWCVVPGKEGKIRVHADITEFCRHKKVRLMDNNILAEPEHAARQFKKMVQMGLKVDFNQGLDARLIDASMANRLAALKWWAPIRLACDNQVQMPFIEKAVRLLREAGAKPKQYSCYMLVKDVEEAEQRALFLRSLGISPFAQPYREPGSTVLPRLELRRFARWVNYRPAFKSCTWQEYKYNTASTAQG